MKKTDGFTLVELVVGILCTSLVSGAIITFMLMGLRTNRTVIDSNVEQQNARIIMSMVESLASEGSITKLTVSGSLGASSIDIGNRPWTLHGKNGANDITILSFDNVNHTISSHGAVLMEGVDASMLSMSVSPMGGCLLGIAIQTEQAYYETSIYNRSSRIEVSGEVVDENRYFHVISPDSPEDDDSDPDSSTIKVDSTTSRLEFLKILTSQVGSTGTIIGNSSPSNIPYTLWYCGGSSYYPDWDVNTPWCACFVSWAINQVSNNLSSVPREANVDSLWSQFAGGQTINPDLAIDNVLPGDLIFFDWDGNSTHETPDLEHVGVVLFLDATAREVYTIEGNSGSQVALRRYSIDDADIFSYTKLAWK